MVLACVAAFAGAGTAHAACPAAVRADSLATQTLLAAMDARSAAGAADARALFDRARRSCSDIAPARAIVTATNADGAPALGARRRVRGIDLIALAGSTATGPAWRLDLARTAAAVASARTPALRARAQATLDAAAWGTVARSWSSDPTRLAWDPGTQSAVVAILGRSVDPAVRRQAGAGIRAFGIGSRGAALRALPLLEHLTVITRIATADRPDVSSAAAHATATGLALRADVRVRAARAEGWSRIDGAWATAAGHRLLVARAETILRRYPHAATAAVVADLRAALVTAPDVQFRAIPRAPFYPWPRDGAWDEQAVSVAVDKPATVSLLLYATGGTRIAIRTVAVEPGTARVAWDGTDGSGATVGPGEYRYNVDARDLAGNRVRVPGLAQFTVARDTTPPTVTSASMRIVGRGSDRRAIVSWDVDEPLSPVVHSWLVLRSGERSRSIELHTSLRRATVRRTLDVPAGDWRATAVFIDGSGNRAQSGLGTFRIE